MNFWIWGALGAIFLTGVIARVIVYVWSCDGSATSSDDNAHPVSSPVSTGDIMMALFYALGIVALLACAAFDFARQAALPAGCGYDVIAGVYHVDGHGLQRAGCPLRE